MTRCCDQDSSTIFAECEQPSGGSYVACDTPLGNIYSECDPIVGTLMAACEGRSNNQWCAGEGSDVCCVIFETAQGLRDYGLPGCTQAVTQGALVATDGGGGAWVWDPVAVDTDNLGTVLLPTSHVTAGRWRRIYDGAASARWWGVIGDGSDETAKLQAAVDAVRNIYLPNPRGENYLISGLVLKGSVSPRYSASLVGEDKFNCKVYGDGTSPIITFNGNKNDTSFRRCMLSDLYLYNDGHSCVHIIGSPEWTIKNNTLETINAGSNSTVYIEFSWVGQFSHNLVINNGGTDRRTSALHCFDNVNGVEIHNNRISGGTTGGAITIGLAQSVNCLNNIIESSYYGIRYAATGPSDGDGGCYGGVIMGNYIEQSAFPICVGGTNNGLSQELGQANWGDIFTAQGTTIQSNFISNTQDSVVPERFAQISLGECTQAVIDGNVQPSHPNEALLWIWQETASFMNFRHNRIKIRSYFSVADNYEPRAYIELKGAMFASVGSSFSQELGAKNFINVEKGYAGEQFFLPIMSSEGFRTYQSPPQTVNVNNTVVWLPGELLKYGGTVTQVQIIDANGDLTGASISLGYSNLAGQGDAGFYVNNIAIDGLTYVRGTANVPVAYHPNGIIPGGHANEYTNVLTASAGTGTGTYSVLITWRGA